MGVRVLFIAAGCRPEVRTFEGAPFHTMRPSLNALIGCTHLSLSRLLWGGPHSSVWWHTNPEPGSGEDGYVCGYRAAGETSPMMYLDYDHDLPHPQVLEALELFREFTRVDEELRAEAMRRALPFGYQTLFLPDGTADPFKDRLHGLNARAAGLHPHIHSPHPFVDCLERARLTDPVQFVLAGLPP